MTPGGDGGGLPEQWTDAMREAARVRATGRTASPETRAKMRLANAGRGMGWEMTPEIQRKGQETRDSMPGRPCLESTKEKIAAAQRGIPKPNMAGELSRFYGLGRGLSPRARAVLAWPAGSMTPMSFDCVADAADHFKVLSGQMSVWCTGKTTPRNGNRFSYLE